MSHFPIFLDIKNINFLIVGAGNVALAKLEALLEFTHNITIVAHNIEEDALKIVRDAKIGMILGEYSDKYLKDHQVIIAATNYKTVNAQISRDAKKANKLVNVVDDPKNSTFIFGANIKRGNVVVSTASSGVSPVLSRLIKQRINKSLPANLEIFSEFLAKNKLLVKEKLSDLQSRRLFWQENLDGVLGSELSVGNVSKAQVILEENLNKTDNKTQAAVYFIGAGPGDPELITLKAINLISKADIILYDRLVADEILAYGRRDAEKINVGKAKGKHCFAQDEISAMIRKFASDGKIVARIKGGDTAIFAHLGEEIAAISDLKVPYQVVPGVTAASGAAAYSGIPLTSRESGKSVRFITIYKNDLVDENYWQDLAKTEDNLAFYMSSNNLLLIVNNLLKFGRDKNTPILIIEQATTIYQKNYIATIGDFEEKLAKKEFISPSMAIIGEVGRFYEQNKWKSEDLEGNFFKNVRQCQQNI